MTASVGLPAFTSRITLRGVERDCTKSASSAWPVRPPGVLGFSATNFSIVAVVRL